MKFSQKELSKMSGSGVAYVPEMSIMDKLSCIFTRPVSKVPSIPKVKKVDGDQEININSHNQTILIKDSTVNIYAG